MSPRHCLGAREAWSESFDLRTPLRPDAEAHLATCKECAAFIRAAEGARAVLTAAAKPPADPEADLRLLEALQAPACPAMANPLAAWLSGWQSAALPRLAVAGLGSFVVTVGVAWGLSAASALRPVSPPPTGAAVAPSRAGYLVNRIDLWIGPEASGDARREVPRPAPPQEPKRDRRRRGGRAGSEQPGLPVG